MADYKGDSDDGEGGAQFDIVPGAMGSPNQRN